MKRRRPSLKDDDSPDADEAPLFSVFLSARQQADLHLAPFDVEGEALPEAVTDDRAD